MEVKVSKLWNKTTSLALRNSGQLRHSSQRHNIHGCPRTHLEEVLFNLIWISAGINPLSLLAVCKTHWLQFYKYPFKSKGGVVANIQIDVPSLKNLRREKTLFLISSSLQEWLTKTRKDNNDEEASVVSPNICGWLHTPNSLPQVSSKY